MSSKVDFSASHCISLAASYFKTKSAPTTTEDGGSIRLTCSWMVLASFYPLSTICFNSEFLASSPSFTLAHVRRLSCSCVF